MHPLPLQEHQCVVLQSTRRGTVQETSGLLQGPPPDVVETLHDPHFTRLPGVLCLTDGLREYRTANERMDPCPPYFLW